MEQPIQGVESITLLTARCNANTFIEKYRDVETFEEYCKACPVYGKSWACPPFDDAQRIDLSPYSSVEFIGLQTFITPRYQQPTSSPEDLRKRSEGILRAVRRRIDPLLHAIERATPGSLLCLPGSCRLCDDTGCTRADHAPCRYPDLMRSSVEALGFNITRAAEDLLHLHLGWPENLRLPPFLTFLAAFLLPSSTQSVNLTAIEKLVKSLPPALD